MEAETNGRDRLGDSIVTRTARSWRSWTVLTGTLLVGLIAAASVFAGSQAAESVAADALVQRRADDVAIAAWTARGLLAQTSLLAQVQSAGLVDEATVAASVDESRRSLVTLHDSVAALRTVWPDGTPAVEQAEEIIQQLAGSAIDDAIAGKVAEANRLESQAESMLDGVVAVAGAERDRRASQIAIAGDHAGKVAAAARWLVALLVPGLMIAAVHRRHRRETAELLERSSVERERRLARSRDRFITAMMHHLRTPLTAVLGFAEILRERRHDLTAGERNDMIEILADEAAELQELIEDLRVAAVADPDLIAIAAGSCDIRRVVEATAVAIGPATRDIVTISGSAIAAADPARLRQIVRSLLRNALNHRISHVDVVISTDGSKATIVVADDGPGLDPAAEAYMFADGDQLLPPPLDALSIGVGLHLSRRLAVAMGGSLSYERREGRTELIVRLPAGTLGSAVRIDSGARKPTVQDVLTAIEIRPPSIALQPVMDVVGALRGQPYILGFEALSRFPTGSPWDWFDTAKQAGLGTELETVAIRAAVEQFSELRTDTFLAVNVSMETLMSTALLELVAPLSPEQVVFELTEDAVVANYDSAAEVVARLQRLGHRVALDDVGSGEVNLWHVLRLNPDVIKLDISLTRGLFSGDESTAIVEALAVFGQRRGARIIAEGVESEHELDKLYKIGVPWVQGYLVGKPQLPGTPEYAEYVSLATRRTIDEAATI
jgi:EAL domain-containing protein (putative c-di-GMP-specific phosphodiesterase class I)/signal transduction histidine kinase